MKNKLQIIIAAILMLTLLVGCAGSNDNKITGEWEFYGVVESDGTDYSAEDYSINDALVGKDYLETYGLDEMPKSDITLTENGLETYASIPGSEIESAEMISDNQMHQRVKITVLDGKKLKEPLYVDSYYTLVDGYLFVKEEYSDSSYSSGNINVYKRR